MLGRGGRDGRNAAFVILLWPGQAGPQLITNNNWLVVLLQLGGRGPSKHLGRVLLEQRVERQRCQREETNALFRVENPYSEWPHDFPPQNHDLTKSTPSEFYSSEPMAESCSVACQLNKACACSLCKCCLACCNKCTCSYANTGADASLARHLLPGISAEYL